MDVLAIPISENQIYDNFKAEDVMSNDKFKTEDINEVVGNLELDDISSDNIFIKVGS